MAHPFPHSTINWRSPWCWRRRKNFICHIHNNTEYNQQWNVFSAFNPSKCTHTWSSGQPTPRHPGSSCGFGALLKGLTSVVDTSCRSRDSNPRPRVTSPTLYPLEPRLLKRHCGPDQIMCLWVTMIKTPSHPTLHIFQYVCVTAWVGMHAFTAVFLFLRMFM